jgi:hypothetical protein
MQQGLANKTKRRKGMCVDMNKPKLTRKQADAIESIKQCIGGRKTLVFNSIASVIEFKLEGLSFGDERKAANEIPNDDFIVALVSGYEVERTPEDDVREYYETAEIAMSHMLTDEYRSYWGGVQTGVRATLNKLRIRVKGVNE